MTPFCRPASLRKLALLLVLLAAGSAAAQEGNDAQARPAAEPAAAPAAPPALQEQRRFVTAEQLEALREELAAGRERLAPLIESVDVSDAEAWLGASPLEQLAERVADPELDEAHKAVWQRALDDEQAASERMRGALGRAELALGSPGRVDELESRLDAMLAELGPTEGQEERPLTRIEEHIAALNGRRSQIALELDQRRQTLARLEEQLKGQAEALDQLRRDRERQAAPEGAEPAPEAPAEPSESDLAASAAAERRAEARLVAAQLDAATLPARLERLRLELRAQELEDRWLQRRLAEVQGEYTQRSTEELRVLTSDLQRLIEREPDVQQLYASELAAMRGQINELADVQGRVRELRAEREEYLRTEEDLTQTLASVRERLEVGGLTETLGGLFLEEQRRLRALDGTTFRLNAVERELAQSRLRSITLREHLRATPAPQQGEAGDEPALYELRRIRHALASGLVQAEEALTDQLRQAEMRLRAIAAVAAELDQVLRETLLWWPSHVPVSAEWSNRIPEAVVALLDPRSWQEIRTALHAVTIGSPATSLLTLLAVALLYRGGRRTGRHLRALAEKTRHRFTDGIGLTFKAMGWSVLRILPVPVLLATTSYRLEQLPETGSGVELVGAVLFSAAIWWLAGSLVVVLISRNGVGTVHFGLNPCMLQRLRRHLAWYLPVQFILIMSLTLAFAHPSDLVFDVLGRVALVAACMTTGFLAWRLFAPSPELTSLLSDSRRRFVRIVAVSAAAALVGLSLAGYLLTVGELFSHAIDTAVVVALVWLCYRLAARALILSELRLRARRTLEQRSMAAAAEAQNPTGGAAPDLPEPHLSMEDINVQTRALVRIVAGGVLVLALYWVWAEILPALIWLDGVTVWSRTIAVGGAELVTRMSLQDLLLAVFLVALYMMAARNLPGLVEVLLTRGTRMDGAARYTVTTLLRYALMVVAVVTVFSLLGLRWSELQWLIAALTLGLGFGLQEVVANFVSGLIMLFERPVRVGDTITIGEYSGTVARIRTRATTIIDWDNREVVVPNKMFITERLINWTLSDTMTRIVLQVNVTYASDVDLVMQSLKEIADNHPSVMKDPAPSVLLLKFGDSSLLFELRAYVDQLRERMDTISGLHREIIKVFRQRGIEIAFPQMDLHIRDVAPAGTHGVLGPGTPAAVTGSIGSA